ncbi:hypothetical protein F7Q99_04005 [Streptomyces kaniharaensis]|uniref:Uncharacterized protein n=1 Tax=Streptomyces kaniharaensis TaxID=212423 RepID=A0A6N7KLP0_9ACTN|nr:hypothetical protein [Streptomyces kaniharaensis]MQS11469.1 hypothetical protein [Streptomyces kaniharaensis]
MTIPHISTRRGGAHAGTTSWPRCPSRWRSTAGTSTTAWRHRRRLLRAPFNPDIFGQTAPVAVGRVLLTFGAAVLAGAVLRRTVVAVGAGPAVSLALPLVAEPAAGRSDGLPGGPPSHSDRAAGRPSQATCGDVIGLFGL